jgi:hypothetical protein
MRALAAAGDSGVRAVPYTDADAARWDAFVARSPTGNLLHTRAFLGYHGARFADRSLLLVDNGDQVRAVLPAAVDPRDPRGVVSHPGATYGGLLCGPDKSGLDAIALLPLALAALATQGFERLLYKTVPPHLHAGMHQVDLYALWRAGARLVRRDLWSAIDLARPRVIERNRARHLRRARELGLLIVQDDSAEAYGRFHAMLRACLAERHAAAPVHSLEEMRRLQAGFPGQVMLWLALGADGECLAGEWILDLGTAWHGQYGAATAPGRECSAQDLLLETIIQRCEGQRVRSFSFGASTEDEGRVLNAGLFKYKAAFGGGAVVHDFMEVDLGPQAPWRQAATP